MKTLPISLTLLSFLLAIIANAHSPPKTLADTITIQFQTGYGLDCNGSGRQCLATQPFVIGAGVAPNSQGIGKAWFDGQGRFTLEIRQVFSTSLFNELEGGSFYLEANVPLPGSVMAGLGRDGQSHTLSPGVHPVTKQQDGSYRIVF